MFARLLPLLLLTGLALAAAEPTRQIEISAKFIEITAQAARKLVHVEMAHLMPQVAPHGMLVGVITEEETIKVIQALNTVRGIDLMSAPRATARSGQHMRMEVLHEFVYPSEWEPKIAGAPWTPTAFESRNVGISLDVTARLLEDGIIDLEFGPEIVKLLGYCNPITGRAVASDKSPKPKPLASGQIYQPIFLTRRVETSVSLNDGATAFLSGTLESNSPPFKTSPTTAPRLLVLVSARVVEVPAQE